MEFWAGIGKSSLNHQLQALRRVTPSSNNTATSMCRPNEAELIAMLRDDLMEVENTVPGLCLSSLRNGVVKEWVSSK